MSKVTYPAGDWKVPLGPMHTPKPFTLLRRSASPYGYVVLIVHAQRFIELYENNDDSIPPIPPVDRWKEAKVSAIARFLDPDRGSVEMPKVHFAIHRKRNWQSLWRPETRRCLGFVDGRHRARFMHHAGAPCFPVEVGIEGASLLWEMCGANEQSKL